MIRAVFAAKLLLDFTAAWGAVNDRNYGWAVVLLGMAVADAGTVVLFSSG